MAGCCSSFAPQMMSPVKFFVHLGFLIWCGITSQQAQACVGSGPYVTAFALAEHHQTDISATFSNEFHQDASPLRSYLPLFENENDNETESAKRRSKPAVGLDLLNCAFAITHPRTGPPVDVRSDHALVAFASSRYLLTRVFRI
jgi:hypothetical protein